jgi:WD40 repeat protein
MPSQVRDLQTGELLASLETGDQARSVAFSPDGELLAVGHYGGSVVLVSTRNFEQVGQTMYGHRARVTALEFSPDGLRLLSGGADGGVQLWDVTTRNPIGSRLTIAPDTFVAATFAPDGKSVIAVPDRGAGVRLDVRTSAWERHACAVAGRPFTQSEWEQELPGRPFREVCAQP